MILGDNGDKVSDGVVQLTETVTELNRTLTSLSEVAGRVDVAGERDRDVGADVVLESTGLFLDKVTAQTITFEAPIGQPVRYKTLVFTVRACETTAADEPVQDYSAYLLIDSQGLPTPGKAAPPARQAFRGWMYARSPGLNPLQHPVYDAWLISCRTAAPAAPTPAPKR